MKYIKGEIYTCIDNSGNKFVWECRENNKPMYYDFLYIAKGMSRIEYRCDESTHGWGMYDYIQNNEDKLWLLECRKQQREVPYSEFIQKQEPNYEIY